MSAKDFWDLGLQFANKSLDRSSLTLHRTFRSWYGVSADVCFTLWTLIKHKAPESNPKHLLWTLFFLKCYNTEAINASIFKTDEKTYRLWVWRFIEYLSDIKVVKWENRLKNINRNVNVYVTLDGTDFRIQEPQPFNPKWYSHKFKSAGVRYEIGLSIGSGDVVWASGGVPCGEWSDLKLARDLYVHVAENEITLADRGYRDNQYFRQPENSFEKRLLARHETFNGRLKNFNILCSRFRHPLKKHPRVFHACTNILQVSINLGEKLFE